MAAAKHIPPPVSLKQQVRDMGLNSSILWTNVSPSVAKALAYQVSVEFKRKRRFRTAKDGGGVRIWRLSNI